MTTAFAPTIVSDARDLEQIRRLINRRLCRFGARIFLYGSRARGTAGRSSDVDVAVLAEQPLPLDLLSRLRDELEESSIRLPVEIMNLSEASPRLRQRVMQEGISWND